MALGTCLAPLLADGKISQETHDAAASLYGELEQDLRRQFGDQAAAAMATQATLKALKAEAARKRFLAGQTIAARQRIAADMRGFGGGDGSGPIDPAAGAAFFDGDDRARYSNVDGRRRAIRARAHAMMDRILADHSSNLLGEVRNKAQLGDIVRELFGEDSGNANARELAEAWGRTADMLRQRFNAAGGDIGKMDKWGLPQSHDSRAVRAVSFDTWRAEILPRLDREAMVDNRTGLPMGDGALELALRDVFDGIRSEGWDSREAGGQGTGALANRRSDARFLRFKSADDWMAYAEAFGHGSPFDAMMGHIDGMARDTALMEILGPNPAATVAWLKDTLTRSAALDRSADSKATDRAFAATRQIDRLYNEITGASMRPENRKLALAFSALRSWQTAAKLGGAMLSAVTDTAFQASTRLYDGLPVASMLRDYGKLFRPGSIEDQKLAVRLGLIAEEWAQRTAAQNRYLGEELTGETSRRLAEGVLRASGLMRWTQAGRWAFGMEFLGHLTDQRGKGFAELDPAFRGMMERNGITEADWNAIRATPLETDRGVEWIKPANVADRALGDRLLEVIARETDHAVPVPDLRTRALVNSVAPRGQLIGEIIKSAALFKSFGISVLLMHGRRAMNMAGPQAARYTAGLVIGSTMMGGLVLLLNDLKSGRDPRQADNPEFWAAAALQGGGFGIFGDFLKSATNRAGSGIAESLAGPLFADVQQISSIATAKNREGAAFKALRQQLPGGTLWYARTAFDRMVADQLQELADPQYRQSWRSTERWAREQGTQFWWAPGDALPERSPDLGNLQSERSEVQ